MAQWGKAQSQVNVAKNTPICGVAPQKPPTENEKIFFRFRLRDLLNP